MTIGASAGDSWKFGPFALFQNSYLHTDGYPLDLTDTTEMRAQTLNSIQQSMADYYGVSYPSLAIGAYVESGDTIDLSTNMGELVASAMSVMPTDVSRILEKCNDILYRAIPELVMASTEAEFQAVQARVLDDVAAAGEAEAWAWCSSEYNSAKEIVEPIFNGSFDE